MNGSNGIERSSCKWCGHAERLPGNEYCSPDCYHYSHDTLQLYQIYCNDRTSLQRALSALNVTIEELDRSLHRDGLDGENAHTAVRKSVESMRREALDIAAQIEQLSEQIAELECRL